MSYAEYYGAVFPNPEDVRVDGENVFVDCFATYYGAVFPAEHSTRPVEVPQVRANSARLGTLSMAPIVIGPGFPENSLLGTISTSPTVTAVPEADANDSLLGTKSTSPIVTDVPIVVSDDSNIGTLSTSPAITVTAITDDSKLGTMTTSPTVTTVAVGVYGTVRGTVYQNVYVSSA